LRWHLIIPVIVVISVFAVILLSLSTPPPPAPPEGSPINYTIPIRFNVGERLVAGKITGEEADLGTLTPGSVASFNLTFKNQMDRPQKLVATATGNVSSLISFEVPETFPPSSRVSVKVVVTTSEAAGGFYTGEIRVEGVPLRGSS